MSRVQEVEPSRLSLQSLSDRTNYLLPQVTRTRRTIALFWTRRRTLCTWSARRGSTAVCRRNSRYRWTGTRAGPARPRSRAWRSTTRRARSRRSPWATWSRGPATRSTYTRAILKVAAKRSTSEPPRWTCPRGEQVSRHHILDLSFTLRSRGVVVSISGSRVIEKPVHAGPTTYFSCDSTFEHCLLRCTALHRRAHVVIYISS